VAPHLGSHVSVDRVKIGLGGQNCQQLQNLGGGFVVFFLGGKNRNFRKVRGLKLLLSLFFLSFLFWSVRGGSAT